MSSSGSRSSPPPPPVSSSSLSLAEGVVDLIYKHIAETHKRTVDDVLVSVKPPAGVDDELVVDANDLSHENKEIFAALVRQDTNRTAFRRTYKAKMDTFKASAQELQQEVDTYMVQHNKQELVIGLRGHDDMQIKLKRNGATENPAKLAISSRISQKEALLRAVETTLRTMRVNPHQPYDPISAVQILSHPQVRPLINKAMHEQGSHTSQSTSTSAAGEGAGAGAGAGGAMAAVESRSRKAPLVSAVVKVKRQ